AWPRRPPDRGRAELGAGRRGGAPGAPDPAPAPRGADQPADLPPVVRTARRRPDRGAARRDGGGARTAHGAARSRRRLRAAVHLAGQWISRRGAIMTAWWVLVAGAVVVAVLLRRRYVTATVRGNSMSPTLLDGTRVVATRADEYRV